MRRRRRDAARTRACEHPFVTAQGSAATRFRRATEIKSVLNAELAAREMGHLGLEDALSLCSCMRPRMTRGSTARLRGGSPDFCVEERPTLSEVQAAVSSLALLRRGGG